MLQQAASSATRTRIALRAEGAPEGGLWGTVKYAGIKTSAAGFLVEHLVFGKGGIQLVECLCGPCDEKEIYKAADDKLYEKDGSISAVDPTKFRVTMERYITTSTTTTTADHKNKNKDEDEEEGSTIQELHC